MAPRGAGNPKGRKAGGRWRTWACNKLTLSRQIRVHHCHLSLSVAVEAATTSWKHSGHARFTCSQGVMHSPWK